MMVLGGACLSQTWGCQEMVECPECSTNNTDDANYCLNCGCRLAVFCPECWVATPNNSKFCPGCGVGLAGAGFGLPSDLAEQWAGAFSQFGWKRSLTEGDRHMLSSLDFDQRNEIVIVRERISREGWSRRVVADDQMT